MTMAVHVYDVVVVGAGPAGCAVALSLSRCAPQLSVLVLSDAHPAAFKVGESLPPEATRILHHLHASLPRIFSAQLKEGLHVPCDGTASAWGSSEIEERHSIMNPFGNGWHLDRAAFDESLRQTVRDSYGQDRIKPGRCIDVRKEQNGHWILATEESDTCTSYQTRWIIDATGRKASVARKLGAKTVKHDGLLAFYAVLSSDSLEEDCDGRTLIESTPTGWWYTSLLSQRRRVVVYHTDATSATAKVARRRLGFIDLVHEETYHVASLLRNYSYEVLSTPGTNFPQCTAAGSSTLSTYGSEEAQWFAVGDAAMAFDPLSAQGMMTALEMGFFVGNSLGVRLTGKSEVDVAGSVGNVASTFEAVWADYVKKKGYYYGTEKRFGTAFWSNRIVS